MDNAKLFLLFQEAVTFATNRQKELSFQQSPFLTRKEAYVYSHDKAAIDRMIKRGVLKLHYPLGRQKKGFILRAELEMEMTKYKFFK